MAKVADDYVGYRIAYCIFFAVLSVMVATSLIQSIILRRAGKKNVQIVLLTITLLNCLFYCVGQGLLIIADYALQRGDAKENEHWDIKHSEVHQAGYAFQNAMIVQILFMWIELFNSVQYGNFVEQEKSVKRYAKIRLTCMVLIWWFSFMFFEVPIWFGDQYEGHITYFGIIPVGVTIVITLVFATIRWRKLFLLMRDCLKRHTRNGDRFIELTKVWFYFTPQFRRNVYPNETSVPGMAHSDLNENTANKAITNISFTNDGQTTIDAETENIAINIDKGLDTGAENE